MVKNLLRIAKAHTNRCETKFKPFVGRGRHFLSTLCKTEEKQNLAKWQVASVVCLERLPLVAPPLTDLQKRFSEMLEKIELENSLFSEHEMRNIFDKKLTAKLAEKHSKHEITAEENVGTLTAHDFEQIAMADLKTFRAAPITTADDEKNDIKSINRCLDRKLVLIVKQKLGQNSDWKLPMAILNSDENLAQAAERAIRENMDEKTQICLYGNAPVAYKHYKYAKPIKARESADGIKMFFFKARLTSKQCSVRLSDHIVDYQWSTYDCLPEFLDKQIFRGVRPFLIE